MNALPPRQISGWRPLARPVHEPTHGMPPSHLDCGQPCCRFEAAACCGAGGTSNSFIMKKRPSKSHSPAAFHRPFSPDSRLSGRKRQQAARSPRTTSRTRIRRAQRNLEDNLEETPCGRIKMALDRACENDTSLRRKPNPHFQVVGPVEQQTVRLTIVEPTCH